MEGLFAWYSVAALVCMFGMILVRVTILMCRGIRAFVFAQTDRSDLLILPVMLLMAYTILAAGFGWPYPRALIRPLLQNPALEWTGVALSLTGLCGILVSLVSFGRSFRVGIDTATTDGLVTTGLFAVSRNPIYVSFLLVFGGLTLIHPDIAVLALYFVFFIPVIHRQVLREEKFMRGHYGEAYTEYTRKVRRYL